MAGESGFILLDAVCGAGIACLFALGLCAATLQAHRSLRNVSRAEDAALTAQYILTTLPSDASEREMTGVSASGKFMWRADLSTEVAPYPGRRGMTHGDHHAY